MEMMQIKFKINNEINNYYGDLRKSLVDVLREQYRLTGTKAPCNEGYCGACTVLIDGEPAVACLTAIGTLDGKEIITIEGISIDGELNSVQAAFEDFDVVQCGMCFPGIVITITHLLKKNCKPNRDDVKLALTGNLCRCTGYERIIDAVMSIDSNKRTLS